MNEIEKMERHQMIIHNFGESLVYRLDKQPEIKTAMAHVCEQVARLSGKELPMVDIAYIVNEAFTVYSHEPLKSHVEAFKRLARSKTYGKITLNDLLEIHQVIAMEHAMERERLHERNKGHGNEEIRIDVHRKLPRKNG